MRKNIVFMILMGMICLSGCKGKKNEVIENQPSHIIALSPSATEMLFSVGAGNQIAACSSFSDYPPEAKELPVVGGFSANSISLEAILSYEPDLVCLTDGMHNFLIPQLEQYSIKYYVMYGTSVDEVLKEIQDIADITGHSKEGKKVIAQIQNEIKQAAENCSEIKKNVYWEVWNSPYMSAGKTSFINDVISLSGGINIFEDQEQAYPIVSEETIIMRQPEVIIIPLSSGVTESDVMKRGGWNSIPAVHNKKIFVVDDNLATRAGPRIGQSILNISSLLK